MDDRLIAALRQAIHEVSRVNREIQAIDKEMSQLDLARAAKQGGLAHAIGSRDALAELFLPEGTTLNEAWRDDLHGLRTGAKP